MSYHHHAGIAMETDSANEGRDQLVAEGTADQPRSSGISLRRIAKLFGFSSGAAAIVVAAYEMQIQSRLAAPVAPETGHAGLLDVSLEGSTSLVTYSPSYIIPLGAGPNCGGMHCTPGDQCCPNQPFSVNGNYAGWVCGNADAVCCPGLGGSITCAYGGKCCNNDHGWAYCCAAGNLCYRNVCIAGPGQCFPGEASVELADGHSKRLDVLKIGDRVLVDVIDGNKHFEPVLAFLHEVQGTQEFITVQHTEGSLRVSPNHLVFSLGDNGKRLDKTAGQLKAGDKLYIANDAVMVMSVVKTASASGMFAPLTASGKIMVDGVAVSNYASHSDAAWIPHSVIHGVFFPVRVYHNFFFNFNSGGRLEQASGKKSELHPYAAFIYQYVANVGLNLLGHYK